MFRQTYLSDAIPYRKPEDWAGIPNGIGLQSLYNGYLITPPRLYAEELGASSVTAMFTLRQDTATTNKVISVLCWLEMIYWPGWEILLYRFDGTTGAFIDRAPIPWGAVAVAWTNSVVQGFDGSIWVNQLTDMIEISDDLLAVVQTITPDRFGRISCNVPVVDKQRDIVIMPSEDALNQICVYTLSTGALVRKIGVSDQVKYICPVDGHRVFVLGTHDLLNLIDYETGVVLMTAQCPTPDGNSPSAITWDLTYRRLLLYTQAADNADGSNTSQIHGYYPVPLSTQLMTPIPLTAPRKGRTSPVLTRLTGDVGEPIVGHVLFADTGDASMVSVSGQANGQGYASVGMNCTAEGSAAVTVSATQ